MDWSKEITRSNFVLELLVLAEAGNVDTMMDRLFEALVSDGEAILSQNTSTPKEINNAMDQIIGWYAEHEFYEKCSELKKIKEKCLK